MWEPRCLITLWASTACYRNSFTFYLLSYQGRDKPGHVACIGEKENLKRPLSHTWEDNIKIDPREMGWMWTAVIYPRIQASGRLLELQLGFIKCWEFLE
jgi:hypothetical protein